MGIKSIMRKDYLTFEADTKVSSMLGKLKLSGKRTGLVYNKGKFLGIINRRALLKTHIASLDSKVSKCTAKPPVININADVLDTIKLMHKSNFRFLPVEKDKQIVGVVNALDLLKAAAPLAEVKALKVEDVKLAKPKPLRTTDKLSTAITVMSMGKFDHAPVFDRRSLVGVISVGDLMKYFAAPKRKSSAAKVQNEGGKTRGVSSDSTKLSKLPVGSFATTTNLKSVKRSDSLRRAISTMFLSNVRDLVVQEAGKVYGLLTVKAILATLAKSMTTEVAAVKWVGLNKNHLSQSQRDKLRKIAEGEVNKLGRKISGEFNLTIHIKEYQNGGGKASKKHKYSVTMRTNVLGKVLTSTQVDWKVETALHKTFANIHKAAESRFKVEGATRKKMSAREKRLRINQQKS